MNERGFAFVSNKDKCFAVTFINVSCLSVKIADLHGPAKKQHACPSYAAQPWDNSALAHQAVKSIPELLSQTDHWLDLLIVKACQAGKLILERSRPIKLSGRAQPSITHLGQTQRHDLLKTHLHRIDVHLER